MRNATLESWAIRSALEDGSLHPVWVSLCEGSPFQLAAAYLGLLLPWLWSLSLVAVYTLPMICSSIVVWSAVTPVGLLLGTPSRHCILIVADIRVRKGESFTSPGGRLTAPRGPHVA